MDEENNKAPGPEEDAPEPPVEAPGAPAEAGPETETAAPEAEAPEQPAPAPYKAKSGKAKKSKKKPRHTKLVAPGDKKKDGKARATVFRAGAATDRLGRSVYAGTGPAGAKQQPANDGAPPEGEAAGAPVAGDGPQTPPKPKPGGKKNNAVALPVAAKPAKKKLSPARRRRRRRRIQVLLVLLVFLGAIFFYTTEMYLPVGHAIGEMFESLRISWQPGDGFPAAITVPGLHQAEGMGNNGIALLGEKDMAIISPTGKELNRIQHGYVNPWMTAGNTRVCVYDRRGKSYTIEARGKNVAKRTTEDEIVFAQMSPGGHLALVTTGRYSARLRVYGPTSGEDADFDMPVSSAKGSPVMLAFHTDDKTFALACISAGADGTLGTNLTFLNTGRAEELATVRADDAIPYQMKYLSAHALLVIYDKYAAVYDGNGQELARYGYNDRQLLAADTGDGYAALLFGSDSQESLAIETLDNSLELLGAASVAANAVQGRALLAANNGVLLLMGQEVLAFSKTGLPYQTALYEEKLLGLVNGREPFLLTAGGIIPLNGLLALPEGGSSASPPGSAAASVPSPASAPESVPAQSSQPPPASTPEGGENTE